MMGEIKERTEIIPANPGYSQLWAFKKDDGGIEVIASDIIAFSILLQKENDFLPWTQTYAVPITVEMKPDNAFDEAVLTPEGQVETPTSDPFISQSSWIDFLEKELEK